MKTFAALSQSQNEKSGLTLAEVVDRALAGSTEFQSAKKTYENALLARDVAFAGFLPSIDLLAVHGPQGETPNIYWLPYYQSSTSLSLTENLWDNGDTYHKYRIAKLTADQAQLNMNLAKGKILLGVAKALFDWSYSYHQYNFAKKNAEEVDKQYKLTTVQFHQGVKTQADFLRFQSQSQRSHLDLIATEKSSQTSFTNLLSVLGMPADSNLKVRVLAPSTNHHVGSKWSLKSEDLVEYKVWQLQSDIGKENIALKASQRYPIFDFTAGINYGSQNYVDTGQTWQQNAQVGWNFLFTLKWNLLDFGIRKNNEQIEANNQKLTDLQLQQTWLNATQDLDAFDFDWKNAEHIEKLTTELAKAEELTFRKLDEEYKAGRASYLDLTTALGNLLDAQSRKIRADFDLRYLFLQALYFKGELDERAVASTVE